LSQLSKIAAPHIQDRLCVLFVCALALLVYLLTLAPDITWAHDGADGGDLITAVMTGGVPHPPGYPTYLLLTWPLARLPFGNPAWRLNLFSALCAACAAGLVALTVVQVTEQMGCQAQVAKAAGMGAGLMLAWSPVLWSQAVIAEVYTLGALLTALIIFWATGRLNRPACLGLSFGLALGTSPVLIVIGPLVAIALGRPGKHWFQAGLGLLIGLAVFGLLPLRASSGAPVNWGDPSTFEGFRWLIAAELYRGYVFALPSGALGTRLLAWASMMARQFTPIGLPIGLWGLLQLRRARPGLASAMLVAFLCLSAFAIGYNTSDSYVYLIPPFILLAIWAGVGLGEVLCKLDRLGWFLVRNSAEGGSHAAHRRVWEPGWLVLYRKLGWADRLSGLRWGAVLVLPLIELAWGWPAADLHADRTAMNFGQAIMAQAPERAILVTSEDAHTFTLWYFRYVRGERLDVMIVDQDMLGMSWYRSTIAREGGLTDPASPDLVSELVSLGRPMCQVKPMGLECR